MGFFAKLFRGKSSSDSARLGQTWDDSLDVAVITTQEIVDGKRQHLSRWGFDVEAGRFTLKLQDGREVGAHGDIVGSYRPADHSWEWAWNNPNATLEARSAILPVKEFGEKYGIRYLTGGMVEVPEAEFATYLAAIAVKVLKAEAAYYGDDEEITYVIALKNLTWLKK